MGRPQEAGGGQTDIQVVRVADRTTARMDTQRVSRPMDRARAGMEAVDGQAEQKDRKTDRQTDR